MKDFNEEEYMEFDKKLTEFLEKDEGWDDDGNDSIGEDEDKSVDEALFNVDEELDLDESAEESADVEDDDDEQVIVSDVEQNGTMKVSVKILLPIKNPRKELDRLVGCGSIKRRMEELLSLTKYNKMLAELCPESKRHEVSLHSVFFGRPGTGKTTVCKIYGSLLHEAGALSKGHVVVCDRGTFIGTLWGDEERSVRQVVEAAQGGVLMIDEAYLLNSKNENDPGKLVIQLLMNILSDERQRDIAVVLCGYKEPMTKLLELNPGLHSRFPNRFEFADFTLDELLSITLLRIKEYGYQFTRSAWEKYKQMLKEAYTLRDPQTWGNGRFIANQLERIYIQHALRCVKHSDAMDQRHLLLLTPVDIQPIEVPVQRPRMGF